MDVVLKAERTVELAESRDYPCEEHFLCTKDDYYLTLHRIPNQHYGSTAWSAPTPYPKPGVLLIHGLCQSSEVFVCHPISQQNLAFVLADAGFDVWMINFRGNKYSNKHKTLVNTSQKYWSFSMDEVAQYDIPSTIQFIQAATGRQFIDVVALGQGSLAFFAALSINSELDAYIRKCFCFQPFLFNWTGWLQPQVLSDWYGDAAVATNLSYMTFNFPRFTSPIMKVLLKHAYGCNMQKVGDSRVALALQARALSSTSVSFLVHSLQQSSAGIKPFNQARKNSPLKITYPTKQITSSITIFCKSDLQDAFGDLLPLTLSIVTRDDMDQMDYVWSCDAQYIWKRIIENLKNKSS